MITFGKFNLADYADCVVVTDKTVSKLYNIEGENVCVLPVGERSKTFATVQKICDFCLKRGLTRSGKIVTVGGGVVGDVAGFAASVYKRGVNLLHVPTTLLAQVDSAIGGKTAVNLGKVKNACGTFYAADTLIDTDFLRTLPPKQISNGFGEITKYRMISKQIDEATGQGIDALIRSCVAFKDEICKLDPTDTGKRRILNAGHTLGHALELVYRLPHGYAVANGLYHELKITQKLGLCSDSYADRWRKIISESYPIVKITDEVLLLALQDKKNTQSGNVCFVLPTDDGVKTVTLTKEDLQRIYA